MVENRRKHPRVRAHGLVAHLRGPAGRYSCEVENISIGGIFVRTDQILDVGTQLEVDLVRPGWKRGLSYFVRVTSRIDALAGRFAKVTPGMGMQFFGKLDEEHRERLLTLLRQLGAPEPVPEPAATSFELPPVELNDQMPLETETPLWQQVSMVEQANEPEPPLDARSFAAPRARAVPQVDRVVPQTARVAPQTPRAAPQTPLAAPQTPLAAPRVASQTSPGQPARAPAPSAAPQPGASPPVAPTAEARLMVQIRGLLLELSNAQQAVTQRDLQIEQLKEELEAALAQLAAAKRV